MFYAIIGPVLCAYGVNYLLDKRSECFNLTSTITSSSSNTDGSSTTESINTDGSTSGIVNTPESSNTDGSNTIVYNNSLYDLSPSTDSAITSGELPSEMVDLPLLEENIVLPSVAPNPLI